VAFTWNGESGDNFDIYVKMVGNVTELRLTTDPADDVYPAWSPDERQIAFFSERGGGGIYLVSPEGGPERKLSDLLTNSRPSWSIHSLAWVPDGSSLIYAGSIMEASPHLWRVSVRNGKEPERAELAGADAWYPAIDFKAGRLAFSRTLTHENIWRLERGGKPAPFLTSSARMTVRSILRTAGASPSVRVAKSPTLQSGSQTPTGQDRPRLPISRVRLAGRDVAGRGW